MIHSHPSGGSEDRYEKLSFDLTKKELELSALLELTKSINSNLPESALYKIFHFSLLGNLNIPKLSLYVNENNWICKVSYGCKAVIDEAELILFLNNLSETTFIDTSTKLKFTDYDIVLPIAHKSQVLAYVLIGGLSAENNSDNNAHLNFIKTFTSILIVAIENKKLARKQLNQEALRKEMEIARDVQTMLFPKQLPSKDKVKIEAFYHPNMSIGGDYYDYIQLDKDKFIVCIADVSGKGIAAALLMSNFQAAIRILVRQTNDLSKIVKELNHCIISNANGEKFVTFFIALINSQTKQINYINAGHNPPLLLKTETGEITPLEKGCTILGAFDTLNHIEEEIVMYNSETLLFAYTDGLTESFNESGVEFGMPRLEEFLVKNKDLEIQRMHEQLHLQLNNFRGNQQLPDDITYLSCLLS